ncbi:putative NAD-dependent epimerase/dehydratase [Nemania sp. NC0429]|nr:putative NAD-dependent epimerase/dehydratase [Nemania sp. NC0429]
MSLYVVTMETETYAVLGATGNTGNSLVQIMLRSHHANINAYCRNQAKLARILPEIVGNNRVKVFAGSINDVDLFVKILQGCRAAFLVVTTNDNIPGCHLSQDSVKTVIKALERIKSDSGKGTKLPKLVLLSSATIDSRLNRNMPRIFKPIMKTAASNVYADLIAAEELLRAQEDWLTTIYIKPGGLSVDIQRGHGLSFDTQDSFISYLDLAAAMVEAATDAQGLYDFANVGVVNTNGGAKFPPGTPLCILVGLLRHFFPWLHPYLPNTGPA